MTIDVTSLTHRRASNRWDRTSVGDLWERLTWSYPDKEALVSRGGAHADPANARLTYAEADALANRTANALLARGAQRGDRVLLFCENSVEAYVAKIAAAKAGLVVAPLNPMLAPDMIAYLIDRVQPRLTIVDAELWPRCEPAFAGAGLTPDVTIPIGGEVLPGSVAFAELVAGAQATEPDVEIHGDDIWQLIFSSGTTSMPKGTMISHHYTHYAAYAFALSLSRGVRFEPELKVCVFLPQIYHIADQIFSFPSFLCGGTLVLGRRHDPPAVAAAIDEERPTAIFGGSPAMLDEVLQIVNASDGGLDASSLKVVVIGWRGVPPRVLADLKRLCGEEIVVFEIFGQTEAISCFRFWPDRWPDAYRRGGPETNYVGVPNPILASRLVDPDGAPLEGRPGIPGEAVYRSPVVTAGYYRDEAATRAAVRDGWFHSGDLCAYDEDGLRIMVDRSKDMIKSGGENVSTQRVEAVVLEHPAVARAAVVGLPHARWDEAVTAVVVATAGEQLDPDGLLAFCRARLGGFETPKGVIVVDELPETVGGKVLKYKLRAAHAGFYVDGDAAGASS